jgi:predicted small lipoprotein YifL
LVAARRGFGRTLAFGVALALALSLAACGRKGPLDLPPSDTPALSSNLTTSQAPASPGITGPGGLFGGPASNDPAANTVDAQGRPIYQPPAQKKSFILDPLLQ